MGVRDIATAEFFQLTTSPQGKLVVVDFTATWCGPCRRVAPQYEALSHRHPDVEFVKVYEHNCREAIVSAGVRSFPTFHFYVDGRKVDQCSGANIRAVEQRVLQHKGSVRAHSGPVSIKLRVDREKARQSGGGTLLVKDEIDVDVDPSEGLEILRFQVLSLTEIETEDQVLTSGDGSVIENDAGLAKALLLKGGGNYGTYPVVEVQRKKAKQGGARAGAGTMSREAPAPAPAPAPASGRISAPATSGLRGFFGKEPVAQPAFVIREEKLLPEEEKTALQRKGKGPESILVVCRACAENCFLAGTAEPCPSISSLEPFVCQSKEACARGHGVDLYSGRLESSGGSEALAKGSPTRDQAVSALASRASSMFAATVAIWGGHGGPGAEGAGESKEMVKLRQKVKAGVDQVMSYEDLSLRAKALEVMPMAGEGGLADEGKGLAATEGISREEGLAKALLRWFKKDFFKWVNKPACSSCGATGPVMEIKGTTQPSPAEREEGGASRVEIYACRTCRAETRFPRYNNPGMLLKTRQILTKKRPLVKTKTYRPPRHDRLLLIEMTTPTITQGRCGEWANCFTLVCRAVNLEARHVVDWTDHVWTEIWIPAKGRWMHADPCENKLDGPLMYEKGWNKRLSYVLAFSNQAVVDVTPRYTRRWIEVLSRRRSYPEKWLASVLHQASKASPLGPGGAAGEKEAWEERLKAEQEELQHFRGMTYEDQQLGAGEQEGRQSGDKDWVSSRGEQTEADSSPATGSWATTVAQGHLAVATVGAPLLGAFIPTRGPSLPPALRLAVAAVRRGGANDAKGGEKLTLSFGGVRVCESTGGGVLSKGMGAVCLVAVSTYPAATAGSLVAARSFPIPPDGGSHGGIGAWVEALPSGVVIAAAAGGLSLGRKLSPEDDAALVGLLAEGGDGTDGGTTGWAMVGWKGPRAPGPWARRRLRSVHAELVLSLGGGAEGEVGTAMSSPSSLFEDKQRREGDGKAPGPVLVELRDKICLNPVGTYIPSNRAGPGLPLPLPTIPGLCGTATDRTDSLGGDGNDSSELASLLRGGGGGVIGARGFCHRSGQPALLVGLQGGVNMEDSPGWTTVLAGAGEMGSIDKGGDRKGGDGGVRMWAWRVLEYSTVAGTWHEDTEDFDDSAVGCPSFIVGATIPAPLSVAASSSSSWSPGCSRPAMLLPLAHPCEIIGWGGDFVNGLQVVYQLQGAGGKAVTIRGPAHRGDHGVFRQSSLVLDVAGGEVVTEVTVRCGSIIDALRVCTNKGQEKLWGGSGGGSETTWKVPPGHSFLGFRGGHGGHMHNLGIATAVEGEGGCSASSPDSPHPPTSPAPCITPLPPLVARSLYSVDPVRRAVGQMLALQWVVAQPSSPSAISEEGDEVAMEGLTVSSGGETPARAEVEEEGRYHLDQSCIAAVETALKYIENLMASPQDTRKSRIRLGNAFFSRKIGRVLGGFGVMRALGFELVGDIDGQAFLVHQGGSMGKEGLLKGKTALKEALLDMQRTGSF